MNYDYLYAFFSVILLLILLFYILNFLESEYFTNQNEIILPTFYENCYNNLETLFVLEEGDYTLNNLLVLSNKQKLNIEKISVPMGWKVILYSSDNFTGDSKVLYISECLTKKFNIINSIKIAKIPVLYQDFKLSGGGIILDIGEYNLDSLRQNSNNTLIGDFKNSISSLSVPYGYKVTLYKKDDFAGIYTEIETDIQSLNDIDFNNDTISVKVAIFPVIYGAINYDGFSLSLNIGNYTLNKLLYMMENKGYEKELWLKNTISSIKIPDNYLITLWENANFTGETIELTKNTKIIKMKNINSIKIEYI